MLNRGLSGSCFCEAQVADYLAQQEADYMTLEIGVNMAPSFHASGYEQRVEHLLNTVQKNRRVRQFFVVDAFPNYGPFHKDHQLPAARRYQPFKEIVRRLTQRMMEEDNRFVSLHGEDILAGSEGLSCDLLHPSDEGYIMMGQAPAEQIRTYL